jgi:hypothetical protein
MSGSGNVDPASMQFARRLLDREVVSKATGDAGAGAAMQQICLRVTENLRDAMGDDGCTALLARALAQTEIRHPVLQDVRRLDNGGISLDRVAGAVEAHGVASVRAGLEALFAALIEILGRLIGEDMAIRLLDHDVTRPGSGGGTQAP